MNPDRIGAVLGDYLKTRLAAEFIAQGHNLTGALVASLEAQVVTQANAVVLRMLANDYGVALNNGVPASRIPYTPPPPRRGGQSAYIQALIAYAQRRMNLRGKEATSAAFAIARKHAREGMPTRSSYAFSQNGRRTGWVDAVLEAEESQLSALVEQWAEAQIEILITNFTKTLN